jgi:hypothetical protein
MTPVFIEQKNRLMKKEILGAFLILLMTACGTSKITSYQYTAGTRGYQLSITVNQDSVRLKEVTNKEVNTVYATNSEFWKGLEKESKSIVLDSVANLKSPSNKRQFDAAMFAKMTFTTQDSVYKSASFDGGKPHEMLQGIVDSLVNLNTKK